MDFALKNDDFALKNDDFALKNDDFEYECKDVAGSAGAQCVVVVSAQILTSFCQHEIHLCLSIKFIMMFRMNLMAVCLGSILRDCVRPCCRAMAHSE